MKSQRLFFAAAIFAGGIILCAQTASVAELKKAVVEIGRLDFKQDIPVRYLDRPQLTKYIEQLFEKDYPEELANRESDFLFLMGFTAEPVALKPLRRKILLENVGGMYNEKTKELLAVEEYREMDMLHAPALVHELRHAIQDQHFHLAGVLGDRSDFDDRRLAALAAIEGDATLVMIRQLGFDPDLVGEAFSAENVLAFSAVSGASTLTAAPAVVKYQLLMPYLEGLRFSRAVLKKKNWHGLNQVLQRPPLSSEQILHPEKYFAMEKPMAVHIAYRPAAGQLDHSGVVGEYFLNVLLADGAEAGAAALGWGGDYFALYRDGAAVMLLWEAHWDTPADGARFVAAFRAFLEKKFKFSFREGREHGQGFLAGNSAAGYFFLYPGPGRLFYARSNERGPINELISGGNYD
ncbi:MAG TPA: hypothetical protein VLQ89_05465 [Candidatus Binatia bacterium]|nr:hypothetical protein [Candidatus Binatia bacterium]